MTTTEARLAAWRAEVAPALRSDGEVAELETALRDELAILEQLGLPADDAWLLAVKRLSDRAAASPEHVRDRDEQLWRELAARPTEPRDATAGPPDGTAGPRDGTTGPPGATAGQDRHDAPSEPIDRRWRHAVLLAVASATTVQLARIVSGFPDQDTTWFILNAGLLVAPFVAAYLAVAGRRSARQLLVPAAGFVAAALVVNLYPFAEAGSTALLTFLHLPVVLWALVAAAWLGPALSGTQGRLTLVRFTAGWCITFVLFALGGGVLLGLTLALLAPIGLVSPEHLVLWVLPSGAAGAVVIAAWLVETRPQVVGAVAPMLAQIFTPLFALMLVAVTLVYLATWNASGFDRELLATLDALLVVVVGLVLAGLAARDPARPAAWTDRLLLVTVVTALVLDLLVLGALAARIGELGMTPNRTAALGLNLVLLGSLAGSAWHGLRFVTGRSDLGPLLRWQTSYLPVYVAWAAVVAVVLPPLFAFA